MKTILSRREFLQLTGVAAGAAALAACAPSQAPAPAAEAPAAAAQPTTAAAPSQCQMDWNPTFPPTPKKYDPPVEVRVITNPRPEYYPPGMGWGNNPAYQIVLEHTGIKFVSHWEEGAGIVRDQKLAADLAAGTLPDMFHTSGLFLEQLIEADAIADIKSIWEATASPLTIQKKRYPDHKWWKQVLRGDKLYGVPFTWGPAYNVDNLCYARHDWLEQLGLKAPETVDEWTSTAKAFQEAGLCEFGISACKNLVTWYHSLDPIFGAYGVMPTCWVKGPDGKLHYDSISPGVKEALATIAGWYRDGLIDPDFYTFGEGDAAGHVGAGKVGLWAAPWWVGGSDIQREQEHPGMKLRPIPYPKGPQGKQGRKASDEVQACVVFRKGMDPIAIEACINNLNWHMEKHVNWEKYQQYGEWRNDHLFLEGFEWEWDENCELKPGPITKADTYVYMAYVDFGFTFGVYPEYQAEIFQAIAEWQKKDPSELNKAQRYILNRSVAPREALYYNQVFDTRDVAIANEYWGNPTKRMQELLPDLQTLESQTFIDIVVGNAPIDRFDEFVNEWKTQGGDEVTAEVNAWYEATYA